MHGGALDDIPIDLYRVSRLRRALGAAPREPIAARPAVRSRPLPVPPGVPRGQYRGDLRVITWNARALFTVVSDGGRARERKNRVLTRLLSRCDALMVTETHGTQGQLDAWDPPPGFAAYWSAGPTPAHAGVGIIVRRTLLEKFTSVDFRTPWTGRAAKLALRGPEGGLDLWAVYFHTGVAIGPTEMHGVPEHRRANIRSWRDLRGLLRERVAARMANADTVWTIMAGDYNWAAEMEGRQSVRASNYTGGKDRTEQAHFVSTLGGPHGLQEAFQPDFSYRDARSRSRIDRIYTNHPTCDQLDHQFQAAALGWCAEASDHRPIFFARRRAARTEGGLPPITKEVAGDPEFVRCVKLEYGALLRDDPAASGMRRLALLKRAIRAAAGAVAATRSHATLAQDDESRLCFTMRYIRAAESGFGGVMTTCLEAYPPPPGILRQSVRPSAHTRCNGGLARACGQPCQIHRYRGAR